LESSELDCLASLTPEIRSQEAVRERIAAICKALAHPARIHIVNHLKQIDRCVCGRIVDSLPLAQSTVSQHLKILKASGLVRGEVEGPRTCYCLNPVVMEEFKAFMDGLFSDNSLINSYDDNG
jgi:DNA-binding transcriptional ArsR family regulator